MDISFTFIVYRYVGNNVYVTTVVELIVKSIQLSAANFYGLQCSGMGFNLLDETVSEDLGQHNRFCFLFFGKATLSIESYFPLKYARTNPQLVLFFIFDFIHAP